MGSGIREIPASSLGGLYSLKIKYTITPPVMQAPTFVYADEYDDDSRSSSITTTCSEEPYYMVWQPTDYPAANIDKVVWYQNVNNEREIIGYENVIDADCVSDVQLDCALCGLDADFDADACALRCDESQCITGTNPIYGGFRWVEVGQTTAPESDGHYAYLATAPPVDPQQEVRYVVKSFTAEGVTNIGFSDPSQYITIYPAPPEINGLPSNTSDAVLDPEEEDLFSNVYFDIQHVQCKGDVSGSISIKKIDDDRDFFYTLDPLEGQNGGGNLDGQSPPSAASPIVFAGLEAGLYALYVGIQNSEGKELCFSQDQIRIKEPAAPLTTGDAATYKYEGSYEVSCHDAQDGQVTLAASGGIPPYTYTLTGSNGYDKTQTDDPEFGGLAPLDNAGNLVTYTYEVWDVYNCYKEGDETITLSLPDTLKFAAVEPVNSYSSPDTPDEFYDISCHGGTDSLEFALEGGAWPYELYIDGELKAVTEGESQQAFIGGLEGDRDYVVTLYDANDCTTDVSVKLTQPDPVILDAFNIIPSACFGSASASLGLKAAAGIPYAGKSYLYSIRHLDVPEDLDFPFEVEQSITIPLDSAVFLDLIAGPYEVTIEDRFGCTGIDTVFITEPERLSTSVTNTSLQCKGDDNGTATTLIEGGTAPFTITWTDEFKTPFQTAMVNSRESASVDGLTGGLYYVFVEDANGCQYPRSGTPFTIPEPATPLDLFYGSLENASCFGQADGSVTLQAAGGWRNVPYKFGTDKTSMEYYNNVYSQLEPGAYQFYVEDGQGCLDSVEVAIEQPEALQVQLASQTGVSCNGGADGSFELVATGGVPPYQFSLDNGLTWSESGRFDGLASGTYDVLVEDANSMCPMIKNVELGQPEPLYITMANTTGTGCGTAQGSASIQVYGGTLPYNYRWEDSAGTLIGTLPGLNGLAAGRYQLIVTDGQGCEAVREVAISNPEGPEVIMDFITPVSCAGGNDGAASVEVTASNGAVTISWPDGQAGPEATGLRAGDYIVEIRDQASCLTFIDVTIPGPEPLVIDPVLKLPTCYEACDGDITLDVTGGNGGYIYQWENGTTGNTLTNLCAGGYLVEVTDATGCSAAATIVLEAPAPIVPDLGGMLTVCEGQQHQLNAGYPGSTYSWTSDIGFTANTQEVAIGQAGTYEVEVTDIKGCMGSASFTLEVSNDLLEAEFLVLTEAIAGDTVVLVNISYPEPAFSRWELPEEVQVLDDYGYHQQLVFPEEGSYEVTLYTELANCQAEMTKQVLVTSATGETTETALGYQGETVEEFTIYPNPSDGKFTASVVLKEAKDIRLRLIDIQGQRDLDEFIGQGEASYEIEYEFNDLLEGVYFLLLEVDGSTQTMKVLIN